MPRITCPNPNCLQRLPFETSQLGQTFNCTSCHGRVLLPLPGAEELPMALVGNPYAIPMAASGVLLGLMLIAAVTSVQISVPEIEAKRQTFAKNQKNQKGQFTDADDTRGASIVVNPTDPSTSPDKSPIVNAKRVALVIGVQDYRGGSLPNLNFADADASELNGVLTKAGYQTTVMTDTATGNLKPTASNIQKQLDDLIARSEDADLVMVTFAGHGAQPGGANGQFYFCPAGADLKKTDTLVSINGIYDKLAKCKAKLKVLFADACRNDPSDTRGRTLEEAYTNKHTQIELRPQDIAPKTGIRAFFSCSAGEVSYEPEQLQHGTFFYYVIHGLRGEADRDRDGEVTFPELEQYVMKQVENYGSSKRKLQRPYTKGESGGVFPLVRWSSAGARPILESDRKLREDPSTLFLDDFASLSGALPPGWASTAFAVMPDQKLTKRVALQCTRTGGFHRVKVPLNNAINGDFAIQVEAALATMGYMNFQHMEFRLYGQQGEIIPVWFHSDGHVRIADNAPVEPKEFHKERPNSIQLVREGDCYFVTINGVVVARMAGGYRGPIEEIFIGLSAGKGEGHFNAMIYSLRIAQLLPLPGALPPPASFPSTLVLREPFENPGSGKAIPANWTGDGCAIQRDGQRDRPCLQNTNAQEGRLEFVTLPRVNLPGNFAVEMEYSLTVPGYARQQLLHLRLEGGGMVASVWADGNGAVRLLDNKHRAPAPGYSHVSSHSLRLVRRDGDYSLYLDDVRVGTSPWPRFPIDTIRIGLSGGIAGNSWDSHPGSVYSISVWSLASNNAGAVAPAPASGGTFSEDFLVARRGALPTGWVVAKGSGVPLVVDGDRYTGWLELTESLPGGGQVVVPCPALGDTFTIRQTIAYRAHETAYAMTLIAGKQSFVLGLDAEGTMSVNGQKKVCKPSMNPHHELNFLEVRKTAASVVVNLNGTDVGEFDPKLIPANAAVGVGMNRGDNKNRESPRLFQFRVNP